MPVRLTGTGIPSQLSMFVTSKDADCKNYGTINSNDVILLPPIVSPHFIKIEEGSFILLRLNLKKLTYLPDMKYYYWLLLISRWFVFLFPAKILEKNM
jgi:hypothetical protein